jgi:metal-responsive CopG/Arc/MetJ family transcriptional regulator
VQKKYQTRLPDDDADRVDEYLDEHEISQSEGVRRLIRAGLYNESRERDLDDTIAALVKAQRQLDDDDRANEAGWHRAAQTGTVISIAVITLLAIVGMLIFGVPV